MLSPMNTAQYIILDYIYTMYTHIFTLIAIFHFFYKCFYWGLGIPCIGVLVNITTCMLVSPVCTQPLDNLVFCPGTAPGREGGVQWGRGSRMTFTQQLSVLVVFGSKGCKTKPVSWVHLVSAPLSHLEGHTHRPVQRWSLCSVSIHAV